MTQIGSFTRTSDGSYTGTIKTLAIMRASGEAQATFGGGDCAPISAFGGARVVGTARCIRYVYPARGANPQVRILSGAPILNISSRNACSK